VRVGAERAVGRALRQELLGLLHRQLVGDDVGRNACPLAFPLEVWPVAAHTERDAFADVDRVDLTRVDAAEVRDELFQPLTVVAGRVAEAETPNPGHPLPV